MLLSAFGPESDRLSLAELARRSGLPKATTLRLAGQLVELGVLEREGGRYRLGLRLFELGATVARQRRLRDAALPFMEDLYEATHETIHLGTLNHLQVLYIEKISGRQTNSVETRVGTRKPPYCTALGKALLAYSEPGVVEAVIKDGLARHTVRTIVYPKVLCEELTKVNGTGVAYDREEYKLGVCCTAAPLLDRDRHAVAALSVTGPVGRFDPERVARLVRTAAFSVSRALGNSPWPV